MIFLSVTSEIFIVGTILLAFAGQAVLCFKVRRLWIRLLPTALCFCGAVILFCLARAMTDWSALGYLLISAFVGVLFCACLIGWGIWGIAKGISVMKGRRAHRGRD